jgi:hypothetical protein
LVGLSDKGHDGWSGVGLGSWLVQTTRRRKRRNCCSCVCTWISLSWRREDSGVFVRARSCHVAVASLARIQDCSPVSQIRTLATSRTSMALGGSFYLLPATRFR